MNWNIVFIYNSAAVTYDLPVGDWGRRSFCDPCLKVGVLLALGNIVIAFIGREHKQRVVFVQPGGVQFTEELGERLVIRCDGTVVLAWSHLLAIHFMHVVAAP
jgi:hypothetical protein